jgi:hypothetical protein
MATRYYNVSIFFKEKGGFTEGKVIGDERTQQSFIVSFNDGLDAGQEYEYSNQFIEKIWRWINEKFNIFKNTELLNRTTLHVSEIRTDRSDIQFKIEESKSGDYDVEFSIENIDPDTNISTYRKETFYQVLPVDEMLAQFGKYYQQNGDRIVGILQRPTIVINI